jgi:hypothetical protein
LNCDIQNIDNQPPAGPEAVTIQNTTTDIFSGVRSSNISHKVHDSTIHNLRSCRSFSLPQHLATMRARNFSMYLNSKYIKYFGFKSQLKRIWEPYT